MEARRKKKRYWNAVCEMHDSVKSFLQFSLVGSCVRHYTYLKTYWTYPNEGDILVFYLEMVEMYVLLPEGSTKAEATFQGLYCHKQLKEAN